MTNLKLQYIGGPTAVIEYAGARFLTDPTFDEPGDYPLPGGRKLTKLRAPGIPALQIGPIDAVLLSHDQHPDNLDTSGRELLGSMPATVTTPVAAQRIEGVDGLIGLEPWSRHQIRDVVITAVPARHGPEGAESVTGEVTGFVLKAPGAPVVYVSGDNSNLEHVAAVEQRVGPVEIAVLFVGAVLVPAFQETITLSSKDAAEAARTLRDATVIPIHTEDWAHFTEGPDLVQQAFADAGLTGRLVMPIRGDWVSV